MAYLDLAFRRFARHGGEVPFALIMRDHRGWRLRVWRSVFLSQSCPYQSSLQKHGRPTWLRWLGYQGRHRGDFTPAEQTGGVCRWLVREDRKAPSLLEARRPRA